VSKEVERKGFALPVWRENDDFFTLPRFVKPFENQKIRKPKKWRSSVSYMSQAKNLWGMVGVKENFSGGEANFFFYFSSNL
jgi:hypothetical protein